MRTAAQLHPLVVFLNERDKFLPDLLEEGRVIARDS
jgi:hypothetical protein